MNIEASPALPPREAMEFDVVIVGAGPAGLATAIRLRQLAVEKGQELSVCVLEKGSEPGAHILSGAVMDPRALAELFPDWQEKGAPLKQAVTRDEFLFLDATTAKTTPNWLLPQCFQNHGNYIVSLGEVTRWLAQQAEALEVAIFPGFAAAEVLYDEAGAVMGVATGDMGIHKDGTPGPNFERGMELHAKYTIFAEGARGHLGRQLIATSNSTKAATRRATASASRSCGRSTRPNTSRAWWCMRPAGRWTTTPTAARSCITPTAARCRSATWSGWTTRTRG